MSLAQGFFHVAAQLVPDALEVARDAGLVFSQGAADLGESLLLGVIQTQALMVAGMEQAQGDCQHAREQGNVALAMRVGRKWEVRDAGWDLRRPVSTGILAVELGKAAAGADGVHVALRENGAQPSPERAAPMEISKQGEVAAFSFAQAIQVCEEGIRKLTCGGRRGGTA